MRPGKPLSMPFTLPTSDITTSSPSTAYSSRTVRSTTDSGVHTMTASQERKSS